MKAYILGGPDGRTPILEPDLFKWGMWMEQTDRRTVAKTHIGDFVHISTVFLGLNHRFGPGKPLLFETMTFYGIGIGRDEEQWRYTTWQEAEAHHQALVKHFTEEFAKLQDNAELIASNLLQIIAARPRV